METVKDGISTMIFEHMPGLCSKDMLFLRHAFAASSLVDSSFFYFTNIPVHERLAKARQRLSEIYMGGSTNHQETVREYADLSAQLCTSIFKQAAGTPWLVELTQAPLLSEALIAGSSRHKPDEREQLRRFADQVLAQGSGEGDPSSLHHDNCLRILSGSAPREMANRMLLTLSYKANELTDERNQELRALYLAAPELKFPELKQQALEIEALHQAMQQCAQVKASGVTSLSTSFSSLPERKFTSPAVQSFYTAFCENYFSAKTSFQQALNAAVQNLDTASETTAGTDVRQTRAPN